MKLRILSILSCVLVIPVLILVIAMSTSSSKSPFSSSSGPISANTPEQMFERVVQSPVPTTVSNLQGVGDTWQGYSIYLRFHATPDFINSYLQTGWRLTEWQRIEWRFHLPSPDYDRFAPPWTPTAITTQECYEGQFPNSWGIGTHYLLVDRASGILYFYGIAA